ncbi:hypothetical protein AGLY_016476 [Aphis glycines]|uniref:Transmembrane protein n=1 Tax=Aphis glycines TaxID=307491 RepID=A0A6G0SXY1_APHGL|nr:hypothetical protein AGLY_016476 [Aphis glycines]
MLGNDDKSDHEVLNRGPINLIFIIIIMILNRSVECIDFTMIFQKNREKQKKINDGKTRIITQNQFLTESFFFLVVIQINHCKYLKFSPNVYVIVIYMQLNFIQSSSYVSLKVLKKIIRIHRHNFFLLAFEVQILTNIVKIMNICKLFCSSKFIKLFVFLSNVKYSRLTNHLCLESFFV